jgi:hypothetical protein
MQVAVGRGGADARSSDSFIAHSSERVLSGTALSSSLALILYYEELSLSDVARSIYSRFRCDTHMWACLLCCADVADGQAEHAPRGPGGGSGRLRLDARPLRRDIAALRHGNVGGAWGAGHPARRAESTGNDVVAMMLVYTENASSFYQDRLGTNTGKAEKSGACSSRRGSRSLPRTRGSPDGARRRRRSGAHIHQKTAPFVSLLVLCGTILYKM